MALNKYIVDLRPLADDKRERIYELLHSHISFTGLSPTKQRNVYTFFAEQDFNPESLVDLPVELIRPAP